MRCRKSEELISLYVDGDLEERRVKALEAHLAGCASCREVLKDFRAMAEAARATGVPEPSDAVWTNILVKVREARAAAPVPSVRPAGFRFMKPLAIAAAALVLVAGGVFIGVRIAGTSAPLPAKGDPNYTLAKLDEAENHYKQAIKALGQAFESKRGELPAEMVGVFEQNLAVVDATITACRQAVQTSPRDLDARNYLLAAYTDKVALLDSAVNFEGLGRSFAEPAGNNKKTVI